MKNLMFIALLTISLPLQAAPDWDAALNGDHRSAESKARDTYRHPRETLEFFGFEESMTVLEISPGGGWYTEILAPLLKENGRLFAAHAALNPPHPYYRRSLGKYLLKLGENHDVYGDVIVTQLQPPLATETAPPGSVDLVLTFRNVHNWINAGNAGAMFSEMFKALKPGGVLGVVEHRARPGTSPEVLKESGYVTESKTIALAEAAGFKLAARSEVNANPRDTTDHPKGVWTLPPSLRLGDEMREHYLAIGESDRMTLKFVKP